MWEKPVKGGVNKNTRRWGGKCGKSGWWQDSGQKATREKPLIRHVGKVEKSLAKIRQS